MTAHDAADMPGNRGATGSTDLAFGPPRLVPGPQVCARRPGGISWSRSIAWRGPGIELARMILGPVLAAIGGEIVASPADAQAVIESLDASPEPPAASRPGAYSLTIGAEPRTIRITAATDESRRYALHTLAQLLRQYMRALPALHIADWPDVAIRGVMLDISRDRVPTMDTLRATIDTLAALKINHLQLYTEHTFAYAGHEDVWRDSSPITPAEARELDAYCTARGIELSANQNCFGHMHRWLKHPRYAGLAEIPPEVPNWTFETDDGRKFTKHGPFSLCPTDPGSIALIRDMLDQLLPCFASPLVNIGCDEAFDVGQGRSRDEVAKRGRAAVYFDHVRAVDAIVKHHGKRSLFWADIALRHPDLLHLIPQSAEALIWGYEGDAPFDSAAAELRGLGLPFWVCPGTSTWCSFIGRTAVRRANLAAASRAALAHGAAGYLITDWGDQGHRQQWPVSMHALAHGAHAAWNCANPDAFDDVGASLHLFGDADGLVGPWLEDLGDIDADLRAPLRNTNAIFTELHRPLAASPFDAGRPDAFAAWRDVRRRAEALRARLDSMPLGPASDLLRDELEVSLRLAEHAADKGMICRAVIEESGPGSLPRGTARIRLAADLAAIAETHRELWLRRSRPGGLDDSTAWYERIIDDYEQARETRS
jgi:hexosaminidase